MNMKICLLTVALSISLQTIDAGLANLTSKVNCTRNHIKTMYYIGKEQFAWMRIHNNLFAKLPYYYGSIKLTKFIGETSISYTINSGELGIKDCEYQEVYLEEEDMCIRAHNNIVNAGALKKIKWEKIFDSIYMRKKCSKKIDQLMQE